MAEIYYVDLANGNQIISGPDWWCFPDDTQEIVFRLNTIDTTLKSVTMDRDTAVKLLELLHSRLTNINCVYSGSDEVENFLGVAR